MNGDFDFWCLAMNNSSGSIETVEKIIKNYYKILKTLNSLDVDTQSPPVQALQLPLSSHHSLDSKAPVVPYLDWARSYMMHERRASNKFCNTKKVFKLINWQTNREQILSRSQTAIFCRSSRFLHVFSISTNNVD
jgi:hypothetical protein